MFWQKLIPFLLDFLWRKDLDPLELLQLVEHGLHVGLHELSHLQPRLGPLVVHKTVVN